MKKILAICDIEADYSYQFMEVINARKTCPFLVHAFTSPKTLLTFLKAEAADVILLASEFYDEGLRDMTGATIFLLGNGREPEIPEGIPVVSKFQRAEDILRIILKQYEISDPFLETSQHATEIIGIYSPLHRVGKTMFALALGQEMGRRGKVLYLNLESCSGFSSIFREEYEVDLTDLLYFARQEEGMLLSQLALITKTVRDLDYVPPAKVPVELMDISGDEWNYLLDQLAASGVYDTILIDFGEGIRGLLGLLSRCDRIFTPIAPDFYSRSKMMQYEEMLELLDYTEILEHTCKISLPRSEACVESGNYAGDSLWSPYAGFVKRLLAGEVS